MVLLLLLLLLLVGACVAADDLLPSAAARTTGTIAVDSSALVTELPVEMSGAGCGIEYLNHEINGGLYSQLILDESFEYRLNATTGLTDQWLAGRAASSGSSVRLLTNGSAALNGRQYVQLVAGGSDSEGLSEQTGAAWAENRGVNRWGLRWQSRKDYEGSVWLANPGETSATVSVALACGAGNHSTGATLVEAKLMVPGNTAWSEHNFTLTPSGNCSAEATGGFVVALLPTAAAAAPAVVNVDFVTVMPGEWGRFHGLPTRLDLATMLIKSMGPAILRFGGGTINARRIGDDDTKNTSEWGLGYSWRYMRGPRWQRPPMQFVNPNLKDPAYRISFASNGWGVFEFLDMCKAGNVSAVLSLNEKDDAAGFIEYLWGDSTTPGGALRHRDGHPEPFQTENVWFQTGNERAPTRNPWCTDGNCTAADLSFALAAHGKAKELGLASSLRIVLAYTAAFSPVKSAQLRRLVVALGEAEIENLTWDQHIGLSSTGLSSVYEGGWPAAARSMGETTQEWAAAAYPAGVRTVVLEENGDQQWGINIHGLRRALNHAQVVAGMQRVPSPEPRLDWRSTDAAAGKHWASKMRRKAAHTLPAGWRRSRDTPPPSQVAMSTQANCLQADGQNYYCPPPDGHANSWDQGTVFYNSQGEIWGQPTYWSAKMMSESHQPYVVHSEYRNATGTPVSSAAADAGGSTPANWSVPTGLDVIALRSRDGSALTVRVVNPQPYPVRATVEWGDSFTPSDSSAVVSTLTSTRGLNASNVATDQGRVVPQIVHSIAAAQGLATPLLFPNYSFTVITIKTDDTDPGWRQDRFVISALDAPPAGLTGRFSGTMDLAYRYAQLRAANFTVVLGQMATEVTAAQPFGNTEKILSAAEHAGLKVLLLPLLSIDSNATAEEQLSFSLSNSTSPALWGWHLADEPPDVAHMKTVAAWRDMIDQHRPGKLSYVNLLPSSCVHWSEGPWGYNGYDGSPSGYLNQYISAFHNKPTVMSFDLYPYFEASDSGAMPTKSCSGGCDNCSTALGDSSPSCCCCNCTRSGYRRNLESHRLASKRVGGVPSWVYLNILPYNGHRDPTVPSPENDSL